MADFRIESDALGERELPAAALYGIHTMRARENFNLAGRTVNPRLIHAFGAVKLACALTNAELGCLDQTRSAAIGEACREMMVGLLDRHILVDALQGGAGTSTNMNVNEVLANRALQIMGRNPGEYITVSPLDDLNMHQSTNDVYPTALRVAVIQELRLLEPALVELVVAFQAKEQAFSHIVKVGRTEYQDAVLTTLGRSMSAFAEPFGRDRWRVYKCEERLRVVNLGGTAIGTGLNAPRQYIFRVTEQLRSITAIGLARGENLLDVTQNCDPFVEVSGILKSCAVNLIKVSGDLRLLSSGPDAGLGEIRLPPRQAGSSIMPGKVNPVIPEAVTQAAITVMANDMKITQAAAMGSLELNPFLPLIADAMLESVQLLTSACSILARFCVSGLEADEGRCRGHVASSTALFTALVDRLGYGVVSGLAEEALARGCTAREIVLERGLLDAEVFDRLVSPENVTRLGHPLEGK